MKYFIFGLLIGLSFGFGTIVSAVSKNYYFGETKTTREMWYTVSKFWDEQSKTDCYIVQSNSSGNATYSTSISCLERK